MIIMHDKRVDRTTNGSGCVAQMKLDQLRKLDAGDGQSVPTLEDVLDRCRGRTGLMLEIVSQGSAEQVLRTVSKHDFRGPVIFASFLHAEVLRIKQIQRSAVTLALLEGVPVHSTDFATQAEVSHVGLSIDSLTSDILRSLKSNGFGVFVYTVNDPRDISWLSSLGADGVISDFPERVT